MWCFEIKIFLGGLGFFRKLLVKIKAVLSYSPMTFTEWLADPSQSIFILLSENSSNMKQNLIGQKKATGLLFPIIAGYPPIRFAHSRENQVLRKSKRYALFFSFFFE